MKKKGLFFVLMVLVLGVFFFLLSNEDGLKDNYYLTVNERVIKENELGEHEYSWSYFTEAQDEVNKNIDLVIEEILSGENDTLSENEVAVIESIYNKALDMDKRNSDGIGDLEIYLNKVWSVSTVQELEEVIILIERELGIGILTNVEVVQDYEDNERNIIYFYPITYAFGADSDYMVNADYMAYKAYIRRACVELWKVYGYESKEAREVTARVFGFYESVANHSKLSGELGDIRAYYQLVTEVEVNELFSNIDGEYLSRRGIGGKDVYSLVDEGQYQYLNDSLTEDNLEVWKEVIVTKILSIYASYGTEEYVEVVDNLNEALFGEGEEKSVEEVAQELVSGLFSSEIDKAYVKKYLNSEEVIEIQEMFDEIKDIYKVRLKNNSWLSEDAKDAALVKLDKMRVVVGLGDIVGYEIVGSLEIDDGSLISDVIEVQKLVMEADLKRLSSGEKVSLIQQTQVNAYYQPLDNSVVIPVAFFELVDDGADYYERLGTLGMILAHEVTHAFDANGSQFDENGNLDDWWSEEDKEMFAELKQEVSDYYSQFEVLNGKYINGGKTVNENIADLGAVACIVDIANEKGATEGELKKMFSSFAGIWASCESDEYMELLLLQDVHAPNEFRVNAVLSSIDEFYEVYDIYPWNEMWMSVNDRVRVW